jgi:hypothetical protein
MTGAMAELVFDKLPLPGCIGVEGSVPEGLQERAVTSSDPWPIRSKNRPQRMCNHGSIAAYSCNLQNLKICRTRIG